MNTLSKDISILISSTAVYPLPSLWIRNRDSALSSLLHKTYSTIIAQQNNACTDNHTCLTQATSYCVYLYFMSNVLTYISVQVALEIIY